MIFRYKGGKYRRERAESAEEEEKIISFFSAVLRVICDTS